MEADAQRRVTPRPRQAANSTPVLLNGWVLSAGEHALEFAHRRYLQPCPTLFPSHLWRRDERIHPKPTGGLCSRAGAAAPRANPGHRLHLDAAQAAGR